jgi:hypothetical protein
MLSILIHKGNANQNYTEIPFTPARRAVIKKKSEKKCWEGCGEWWGREGTFTYCLWEYK